METFLGSFWGFVCRQPPPANPFSKPLKRGQNEAKLSHTSLGRPKICKGRSLEIVAIL